MPPPTAASLSDRVRAEARRLGFEAVGIAPLRPSDHADHLRAWLDAGRHGSMDYLGRPDAVKARVDPASRWPELGSAVVVAHHYATPTASSTSSSTSGGTGVIARYARGRDYHRVVKKKLLALLRFVEDELGGPLPMSRAYVDTGPVLERELARRAGLGWFGRNTMLIDARRGSYFFLGSLLLPLDLDYDEPFEADRCGSCTACLDACPTGALLGRDENGAPVMDARLCISYLTIENRGEIPRELRPAIGNRVYGCDICQEVCPFPRKFAQPSSEPSYGARGPGESPAGVDATASSAWHPGTESPSLVELLATALEEASWDSFSRGSAMRRAGRAGFARNVCVGLGNWGSVDGIPVLRSALRDSDPLVRGHAAWALGEIRSSAASEALEEAASTEEDPFVREELARTLDRPSRTK